MKATVRGAALTAVVAMALAGCRPATQQAPIAAPAPSVGGDAVSIPTSSVTDVRSSALKVAKGMALQIVEFADARHGYASFVSSSPVNAASARDSNDYRYASTLFATIDGGKTWKQLADPRQPSLSPQIYTVDARTIVLLAEPYGWYVSRDGGATFGHRPAEPAPPELDALGGGPYRLDCENGCVLNHYTGGRPERVNQPTLPGALADVAQAAGDLVWTASLDSKGVAFTAVGRDAKGWQRHDVPAHPGGVPTTLELQVSADGRDVWLVGYLGGGVGGVGSSLPMRRKDVGLPLLWLFEGDRWVPKGTVAAPTPSLYPYVVAAIGGGLAAVTGPHGLALVDVAWRNVEMSPRPEFVLALRDGTVFASAPRFDTVFLAARSGTQLRWMKVVVTPAA